LFLGLWVSLVLPEACSTGEAPPPFSVARDDAGIETVTNRLNSLDAQCALSEEPTLTIGRGQAGDEYALYRVFGATRLSDGRVALVNQGSDQVRVFDAAGRFLFNAGHGGDGPGEFKRAFGVWRLPGDTLWVGNYPPWRFEVFAPDGAWVRTVRPRLDYITRPPIAFVLDDGRFVLARFELTAESKRVYQLLHATPVMYGPDGTLLDTLMTLPNGRYGPASSDPHNPVWLYPLFESFAVVKGRGQEFIAGHGATPKLTVYEVSDTVRVVRRIRWTTGDRAVTEEIVAEERRRLADAYKGIAPAARKRMVDPLIGEERPVADTLPAFTEALVGRDGRMWVKLYRRPADQGPSSWVGFNADGRAECRLFVPRDADVLEIGEDYLLVHDTDDLDVEGVSLYALSAPPDTAGAPAGS
jgi:hypothetical protein